MYHIVRDGLLLALCMLFGSFLCSEDSLVNNYHTVMVFIEIKPEYTEQLKQEFRQVKAFSDADEDLISFDIYEDSQNISKISLHEVWKDKQAHTRHLAKPYIADFIQRLKHRLVKPHEVIGGKRLRGHMRL